MKIQFESLPPKTIEEGGRILFHYFRAIVRGRNQFKPTYRYRDFVVYLIGVFLFILLIALIGMIFIEKETPSIVFINLAFFCFILFCFVRRILAERAFRLSVPEVLNHSTMIQANEKGVKVTREKEVFSLSWEEIRMVVVNPHSILFLPNTIEKKSYSILLSYDQSEDVKKLLEKNHQERLMIDYTK